MAKASAIRKGLLSHLRECLKNVKFYQAIYLGLYVYIVICIHSTGSGVLISYRRGLSCYLTALLKNVKMKVDSIFVFVSIPFFITISRSWYRNSVIMETLVFLICKRKVSFQQIFAVKTLPVSTYRGQNMAPRYSSTYYQGMTPLV